MTPTRSARYLLDSAADWLDIRMGIVTPDDAQGMGSAIVSAVLTLIVIVTVYLALDLFGGPQ